MTRLDHIEGVFGAPADEPVKLRRSWNIMDNLFGVPSIDRNKPHEQYLIEVPWTAAQVIERQEWELDLSPSEFVALVIQFWLMHGGERREKMPYDERFRTWLLLTAAP